MSRTFHHTQDYGDREVPINRRSSRKNIRLHNTFDPAVLEEGERIKSLSLRVNLRLNSLHRDSLLSAKYIETIHRLGDVILETLHTGGDVSQYTEVDNPDSAIFTTYTANMMRAILAFNPALIGEYLTGGTESLTLLSHTPKIGFTERSKNKDIINAKGGQLITPDIVGKIHTVCEATPSSDIQNEPVQISSSITIFKDKDQITSLINSNRLSYGSNITSDEENFVVISTKVGNPLRDYILSIGILPTRKSLCLVLGVVSKMRLEPGSESIDVVNQIHSLLREKL